MQQKSNRSIFTGIVRIFLATCVCIVSFLQAETLRVDFGNAASPVQSGYQAYTATDRTLGSFTTQSYLALGTTVSLTPSWAPNAVDAVARMLINRDTAAYEDATKALMQDWIGSDTFNLGNPLTLTISGLPSGEYVWVSYHSDPGTSSTVGTFDVTVNDAAGSEIRTPVEGIQCTNVSAVTFDSVAKFETTIISNGIDAVTLVFDLRPYTIRYNEAYFVMNGFVLKRNDPCYNAPPQVDGPEAILAIVGKPLTMDITVSDDGKPYVEGCDPANPQSGTAYPLAFQWAQQNGSGTAVFTPASADQKAITVTFPMQGKYELSIDVSDAPAGVADRKTTRHTIAVEVIKPLGGDADFNQAVNFEDLIILISQWLSHCPDNLYCADFDNSGLVTLEDFSILAANWMIAESEVVINEFVASNRRGLADGDGNYSDWIELYNQSSEAVSLEGWFLTDNASDLKKWPFPANTILPGEGYLVVFASGQSINNYVDPAGYLHTNFALAKDGEYLALVAPDGRVIHEFGPAYPPQETDISYGLWYGLHRYFAIPTPLGPNSSAFLGYTDKPNYSHKRGFYNEPFTLEITSDTPEAFIHYTLDGSEPTEQHGLLYDPNTPLQISTTTVVRSAAIKPGYRPGNTKTATFIFIEDVAQQPADPEGWPDHWGYAAANYAGPAIPEIFADYEMDPRVVNHTLPGYSVQEALMAIPSLSIAMDPDEIISPDINNPGLWANPLITTEYKCSIEYIPVNGSDDFQEDCKVENHGFSSRRPQRMQKHNLRITFTREYGASELNHPLFPESPVETFKQLILRACSTDSWALVSWGDGSRYRPNDSQYTRDVWMKKSMRDMGHPSSYGSYVHLYVNGLYFGLFDLTESVKEAFCADHFGGRQEDWTVFKDFEGAPPASWTTIMNTDVSSPAGYTQALDHIDIENFADYMLLHFYADAEDWPHHNGIAVVNAVSGDGKLRFFVWDQEIVLDHHGRAAGKINSTAGVAGLFQKMRTSEEFRLLFADRFYKHCFNNGALSISGSQNRYLEIANWIDQAIVAESARWGDVQMSTSYGSPIVQPNPLEDVNHRFYPPVPNEPNYFFTREGSWVVERDNIINNYIPAKHDTTNSYAIANLFRNNNLYPAIEPPLFRINETVQSGGYAAFPCMFSMDNLHAFGSIYYTLDGTDPREYGTGNISSTAILYTGDAVELTKSVTVRARLMNDSTWSALHEATFAEIRIPQALRVTELMYHPAGGSDNSEAEWLELQNIGSETINLNRVRFTEGIDYRFGDIDLAPGHFLVLAKNIDMFNALNPDFEGNMVWGYEGMLSNSGERIRLEDVFGKTIEDFEYKDGWYPVTDGGGFSLTIIDAAAANDLSKKSSWKPSSTVGGSPGQADTDDLAPLPGSVVINEILAHAHAQADWIELYNTTDQPINIGGWYISDSGSTDDALQKYQIPPGTIMPPYGYVVFYEGTDFTNFAFSANGETAYLTSAANGQLGSYRISQSFGASPRDIAFGRHYKAGTDRYDFVLMSTNTPGAANAYPFVGPLVISEIMYHPPQFKDAEYVELLNISNETVPLYDAAKGAGWKFTDDGGFEFYFPAGSAIAPGERILIVKDLTIFASEFTAAADTQVFEWGGDGNLSNSGEKIELSMPGDISSAGTRYYIRVDRVVYSDGSHPVGADPWPAAADGNGHALHRIDNMAYGNDVSNWTAAAPSPGG